MFPRISRCATLITASCMLAALAMAQNDEPRPEEVTPIGPGYLTKGYKTMINGQVVETTDGRTYDVEGVNGHQAPTPSAPAAKPMVPQGDWPAVVTIVDGVIVDPETMQEVNNLPSEIELIPMGLKKIKNGQAESMAPMFRIKVKNPAPGQTAKSNQHPASMGPDFSGLLAAQEDAESETEGPEKTEEEAEDEDESGGGLLDFLFGDSEPEEEQLEEDEMMIDLNQPLTQAEMEALQSSPEFQRYLDKQRGDNSRNFYSSKGRGKRSTGVTKPPSKIVVEKFNPEEWEEEESIAPTPNMAIGKLVSVDASREIAVCWLQTRYIRANMPMVTRNYEMETTGVLLPAGEQDGRAAGFWIAQGNPTTGDEVIVPGPDYKGLIQPWVEVTTSAN